MDIGMRPERKRPSSNIQFYLSRLLSLFLCAHFFFTLPFIFLHSLSLFFSSGLRPDSRLPLVVIPEDQCRIKREAKQKMRSLNGLGQATASIGVPPPLAERKASCSPQQVTSTESPSDSPRSAGLTMEQQELINRLVTSQQQFDMPSDEALSKLSVYHRHIIILSDLTKAVFSTDVLPVERNEQAAGVPTLGGADDHQRSAHRRVHQALTGLQHAERRRQTNTTKSQPSIADVEVNVNTLLICSGMRDRSANDAYRAPLRLEDGYDRFGQSDDQLGLQPRSVQAGRHGIADRRHLRLCQVDVKDARRQRRVRAAHCHRNLFR